VDFLRFIVPAARERMLYLDMHAIREWTNVWWSRGPFFIRVAGLGRRWCVGNYVFPKVPRMLRYAAKRAILPARIAQVARTRALCVPRCLKSFPISVAHTIAVEHCVAGNTPCHCSRTRLSDEFASGLALGPDCLGFSKRRRDRADSYSIPGRRLEPNREGEKGRVEGTRKKRSEWDQRVVRAARGIISSKYVVKFFEILHI